MYYTHTHIHRHIIIHDLNCFVIFFYINCDFINLINDLKINHCVRARPENMCARGGSKEYLVCCNLYRVLDFFFFCVLF